MPEKYIDFGHTLGIRRVKLKKYTDFRLQSGKLVIQINDDY